VKIHAIETGTVQVKRRQIEPVAHGAKRRLDTLLDKQWTEPLPILAWLIEHPDGLILIDTGETARASDPGYYPRWHPYFRSGVRFQIQPEQEIAPQLRSLGFDAADIPTVVMTHLHTDHAGGLHAFRHARILVSQRELGLASGARGRLSGYPNNRWPEWFAPEPLTFLNVRHGAFDRHAPISGDAAVVAVPTPGHTRGHISVIVHDDADDIFLAGDSSYTEAAMLAGEVDGIAPDENEATTTLTNIRTQIHEHPLVYLPSHDPQSKKRLKEKAPLKGGELAAAPVETDAA
jgi:glyoxylase-like metal-dependent hydrolase (beta-lactamase superfamily II)